MGRDGVLLRAHASLERRPRARGRPEAGRRVLRAPPADRAHRRGLTASRAEEAARAPAPA